eukprot:CAMPEP_0196761364 /NCGR_PEP_ID=MMETSP1095-20130614/565_1 /TAXON_ID=96789 ORGANISM="Chromulina nebulosa, Strain UTEXLB2642" /NCGR_SAMPLE_ID=MMETSP1095 /ASSEMBLY_ACC=CAM_ASM_000446 /LENGTH=152 /DNA_ID=CAMNT_0042110789 /DNA_START=219 /DNA_END=677 /DNA_ORIENTATION=+
MKEVQQLMNDPSFKREMEQLTKNPKVKQYIDAASEVYSNPDKANEFYAQIAEALKVKDKKSQLSDAQLGLRELSKVANSPELLAETLEMLKDPEIAKEVKEMMNNPEFISEMKKFTSSKDFQHAKSIASDYAESLSSDPVKMKQLESMLKNK